MQDTKYMTAAEKEKVLRAWELFLKSGLSQDKFTESLYNHLIQHCSFIAHYNRGGFYSTYFADRDGKAKFLSQFDCRIKGRHGNPPSVEYGDLFDWCSGDYADINKAMVEVAATYIPALLEGAEAEQKAKDIAIASALLAKYGMEIKQ